MPTTFTKIVLSGSTDGKQIAISSTDSPGTTIHTAHATSLDEVWLYAVNTNATASKLTVQFGSTTSPNDNIEVTVPGESGYLLAVPGLILTGGLVVKAFGGTASHLNCHGFVNRIT